MALQSYCRYAKLLCRRLVVSNANPGYFDRPRTGFKVVKRWGSCLTTSLQIYIDG